MAVVVVTRLYLLAVEQVTGPDVEPAGNSLHQLIAATGKQSISSQQNSGYTNARAPG
jgi:hypothetical protein